MNFQHANFNSERIVLIRTIPTAVLLGCVSVVLGFAQAGHAKDQSVQYATTFEVQNLQGQPLKLDEDSDGLTVICFLGTECPLAKLYAVRLQSLSQAFSDQKVRFVGINSNRQDSAEELAEFVDNQGITFPVAKDFDNVIADQFNVVRTPEVIVVDSKLKVRYRGRVDDQYLPGVSRNQPDREDLKIAIGELLTGKSVSIPLTKPEGCLLGRVTQPVAGASVTFCDQVMRVLQQNCVECHHKGDIGPFALTEYDEVVGWGEMMVEVIDNKRMPPWHADPSVGHFVNARGMSENDKQIIRDWVDQGMPYGEADRLPAPIKFSTGWQLPRQPDLVVQMRSRPFMIPPDGTVEYQYFVVDPKFEKDVWVSAAEVVPGNRSVVHHSIVFIRPPDGTKFTGIGWLAAYVPGQRLPATKPNLARRIPAGSRLVFQQHYTPNGTSQTDITKIGLLFADEKDITEERLTLTAMDQGFELKPYDANQRVQANMRPIPYGAKLLAIAPHMHYRGNQFKATMVSKDGKKDLLRVPDYDFNWQHNYELAQPLDLNSIKEIQADFVFDNSKANPFNPAPASYVTWGDQTWEEMAIAFFDVSRPRKQHLEASKDRASISSSKQVPDKIQAKAEKLADDFLKRFDTDGDGLVQHQDVPLTMRVRAFGRTDLDHNQTLNREELVNQFRSRAK